MVRRHRPRAEPGQIYGLHCCDTDVCGPTPSRIMATGTDVGRRRSFTCTNVCLGFISFRLSEMSLFGRSNPRLPLYHPTHTPHHTTSLAATSEGAVRLGEGCACLSIAPLRQHPRTLVLYLEGLVESGLACAVSGRAAPNVVEMSCSQVVAFRLVAKTARLISLLRTHIRK